MSRQSDIKFVHWEITSKCNIGCDFCHQKLRISEDRQEFINKDDMLKIAEELISLKVIKVTFSGGEPLLRGDLLEGVVPKFSSARIFMDLQTNGTLLRDAGWLKEMRKIYITYSDAFSSIDYPQSAKEKMVADIVLHNKNINMLGSIVEEIKQKDITCIRLIPGLYLPSDYKIKASDLRPMVDRIEKVMRSNENLDIKVFHHQTWLTNVLAINVSKIEHLYIAATGKIGAFPFLPTGNQTIFKGSLYDEWQKYIQHYFLSNTEQLFREYRLLDKCVGLSWRASGPYKNERRSDQ